MSIRYEKDGSEFRLVHEDSGQKDVLNVLTEVAVAYSYAEETKSYITHRHGNPEMIRGWVNKHNLVAREQYDWDVVKALGLEMKMISSSEWNIDDLNWIIENINGLNRVAKERGLKL